MSESKIIGTISVTTDTETSDESIGDTYGAFDNKFLIN